MTTEKFIRVYQHMIISGVIVIFCVIATIFALVPAVGTIQQMLSEGSVLSDETDELQEKLNALNTMDEATIRGQLTEVLSAVPAERSFPTVFETVEGVAAKTGVSVINMNLAGGATLATPSSTQVSAADKKLGTRTIPFSVSINGSLTSVQEFIAMIPKVRRLFRIRVFSISFPKDLRPLTVNIEMDAFYEPLPASIGNAKSVLPILTEADQSIVMRLTELPLATFESGAMPPPLIGKIKENPFAP